MNECLELFRAGKNVGDILERARGCEKEKNDMTVNGATPTGGILFTSLSFLSSPRTIFYVAPTLFRANRAYESFSSLLGPDAVSLYASDEIVSTHLLGSESGLMIERLHAVKSLLEGRPTVVVTHPTAYAAFVVPPEDFRRKVLLLHPGDEIKREDFIQSLVDGGYSITRLTRSEGDASIRGEIIDIWPLFCDRPVRLEMDDERIESLHAFDPETQRRDKSASVASLSLFPRTEALYGKEELACPEIQALANDPATAGDLIDLTMHVHGERAGKYLPLLYGKKVTVSSYAPLAPAYHASYEEEVNAFAASASLVTEYLSSIPHPASDVWSFPEDLPLASSNLFLSASDGPDSLATGPVIDYSRDLRGLVSDIKAISRTRVFLFEKKERLDLLRSILDRDGIALRDYPARGARALKKGTCYGLLASAALPFSLDGELEVLTEDECFRDKARTKVRYYSVYQSSRPLASKEELTPGDYVVHEDYGIARYDGLKSVTLDGVTNDYLVLAFKNMPVYLPVSGIGRLELYRAAEGTIPPLTSIGKGEWERKKAKVRERLEELSTEIIALQAARARLTGFKYPGHDAFDDLFASDFGHEETKDQSQAIKDVLDDLESGHVMDRLVCGDVGYGKTEVALRAAFKVACSGKQVALLAPTTLLARQHYETFRDRFTKYGLSVALLCRLTPRAEQKDVLSRLKAGKVDVVIGTHRLLSADVAFHDLGLLVIDEEQRFGVVHKERIKRLKENVNVLSLSATPIPRTLELSIMGLRSMSLITTAPKARSPVQTYVLDYNPLVVKDAIERELGRGGQVFYLHNQVSDIVHAREALQAICPEARIVIAHGQMDEGEMEDAVSAFLDGEYDVLLCTTIIENGIDMPNVNTILIENASGFGLAQLYQLRGRVGRSSRIAYSYLFMMPDHPVTDTGEKRLAAIKEFTNLGGGYELSVRDLAIRGAGDILGKEQSGFIETIGMDLYLRMLDETVHHKKEEPPLPEASWSFKVSQHVEERYAGNESMIIAIHGLINRIRTKEDVKAVLADLADRFGPVSAELAAYAESVYLASLLRAREVERLVENPTLVLVDIPHPERIRERIMDFATVARSLDLDYDLRWVKAHVIVRITHAPGDESWIHGLVTYLEALGVAPANKQA